MTEVSSNLTTGRTNDLDQFNLPSSQRISARDSIDLPCPVTKVSVSNLGGVGGGHGKFGGIPKQHGTNDNSQINKSGGLKNKRNG